MKQQGPGIVAQLEALRQMPLDDLRVHYAHIFGEEPTTPNRQHLWKRLAWELQARAFGQDDDPLAQLAPVRPVSRRVTRKRSNASDTPRRNHSAPVRDPRLPQPGTVLVRKYKGVDVRVEVLEKGFAYDGRTYRSLSAVAEAVTGAHWNGFLFFAHTLGLKTHKGGSR